MIEAVVPPGQPMAVEIGELKRGDLKAAAALIGRAYRDNPVSVALNGADARTRLRRAQRLHWLRLSGGATPPLAASEDGKLVGVYRFSPPGSAELSLVNRMKILAHVAMAGPRVLMRTVQLIESVQRHVPAEPVWFLGPVAVDPDAQGTGIGTQIVEHFLSRVDENGGVAFLDTDKLENVGFYERFGFETVDRVEVIGVDLWFMRRKVQHNQAA